MSEDRWMQTAVKRPGALRKWLGIPEGKRIPVSLLRRLLHAATYKGKRITPLRKKQINLALIFHRYRPSKKK